VAPTDGIEHRFTVHGMRYTFTDLVRRANLDAVVRRALTGHVTERMQHHYSHVGNDEQRAAMAGVLRLVPPRTGTVVGTEGDFTASAGIAIQSAGISGAGHGGRTRDFQLGKLTLYH
jgi:hypothetical protein